MIKRLILIFLLLFPGLAFASVTGMDDINTNLAPGAQFRLDNAITTYYQHPSTAKVRDVLDIMNNTDLLRKKTAWAPMVGFLTVIFADNKEHIFDWMSLYDYNGYAQNVFATALLHAKLPEAASVFAQAHQWSHTQLDQLHTMKDNIDLKHLPVAVPGHIDTLWGAFFASGDKVYVDEVIGVLIEKKLQPSNATPNQKMYDMLKENKELAQQTLRQYAPYHQPVRDALAERIAKLRNGDDKRLLERILRSSQPAKTK